MRDGVMKAAVVALVLAVMSMNVEAATDAEEFERAGLFGRWAQDCKKPPSPNNWHFVTELSSDGSVRHSGFDGHEKPIFIVKTTIISRLADNRFEIRSYYIEPVDPVTIDFIVVVESDRQRAIQAVPSVGKKVLDGPWFYRCQAAKPTS